jgi:hypothetical protein
MIMQILENSKLEENKNKPKELMDIIKKTVLLMKFLSS